MYRPDRSKKHGAFGHEFTRDRGGSGYDHVRHSHPFIRVPNLNSQENMRISQLGARPEIRLPSLRGRSPSRTGADNRRPARHRRGRNHHQLPRSQRPLLMCVIDTTAWIGRVIGSAFGESVAQHLPERHSRRLHPHSNSGGTDSLDLLRPRHFGRATSNAVVSHQREDRPVTGDGGYGREGRFPCIDGHAVTHTRMARQCRDAASCRRDSRQALPLTQQPKTDPSTTARSLSSATARIGESCLEALAAPWRSTLNTQALARALLGVVV